MNGILTLTRVRRTLLVAGLVLAGFWGRVPRARRFRLSGFRSGVLVLALMGAWLAPVAAPPAALAAQIIRVFRYTGAMQNWTVPAGVHQAHFDVRGAKGGGVRVLLLGYIPGGLGGRTVAEVRVVPGEVIHIFVGGQGHDGGSCPVDGDQSRGGFNGGGDGGGTGGGAVQHQECYTGAKEGTSGGGGGGASDIRVGGTRLTDRYIVAGGGGGSAQRLTWGCGFAVGGDGSGINGGAGVGSSGSCIGGAGATRTSGGVETGFAGQGGSLGSGGSGWGCGRKEPCGGGGGGGYYGGGGGWLGAGGGGGSGFGPRVDFPPVKFYTGVQKGNGQVIVTFQPPG